MEFYFDELDYKIRGIAPEAVVLREELYNWLKSKNLTAKQASKFLKMFSDDLSETYLEQKL